MLDDRIEIVEFRHPLQDATDTSGICNGNSHVAWASVCKLDWKIVLGSPSNGVDDLMHQIAPAIAAIKRTVSCPAGRRHNKLTKAIVGHINLQPDDRIAALERRLVALEKAQHQLRNILNREVIPRRETLRERLQPKIKTFHHYWPRELKVPPAYRQIAIDLPAPTFAIVSPSLEYADFLRAAIDSVLSQNYPALSYHVQDAASSDRTVDVLKSYGDRITWESAPDRGQAHALNMAFGKIRGDIMGYLNSDDLLMPGTLAYVARAFAADPKLDVVYGHRICIDESGDEIGRWVLPRHDPIAIKWLDFIPQETMFWRRRVWDELGGFDESFEFALDWDFILRAHAKKMRFARLPRFLGCFRVHDAQKTTSILDVGQQESQRLRRLHLGFEPTPKMIRRATAGYLWRQVFYHRLYKMHVLDY